MRAVNLLPKDGGRQRRRRSPVLFVGVLGGCTVVSALALMFMFANAGLVQKQEELQGVHAELAAIPPPPEGPSTAETGLVGLQAERNRALETALASRIAWDGVLRRFSLVLPEDIWLDSLSATAPESAGATGTLTIVGFAYSHDGVARLLARLSVLPDLVDVQLGRSAMSELEGREVASFTIVAGIRKGSSA